MAGVKIS